MPISFQTTKISIDFASQLLNELLPYVAVNVSLGMSRLLDHFPKTNLAYISIIYFKYWHFEGPINIFNCRKLCSKSIHFLLIHSPSNTIHIYIYIYFRVLKSNHFGHNFHNYLISKPLKFKWSKALNLGIKYAGCNWWILLCERKKISTTFLMFHFKIH